jgi:addiction module RelE/StbE family toxin
MLQKKYKIEYLPVADRDLAEIFSYIAVDLAASQAAAGFLEKIGQAVQALDTFPYAHPVYHSAEIRTEPFEFRSLIVGSYLIFYYVTENTVTIARVVYGKRDMRNIVKQNKRPEV